MHKLIHEIIAAVGGLMFLIVGIGRQRERRHLISAGKKAESPLLWSLFIIVGICLLIFAIGLIFYQLNRTS
jgi:UPF0716 family protein affecting phage T7 exclusion